jgi:DNA-binding transcriptional ArsR family regulator
MTNSLPSLDHTFQALADPARREAVERLCAGPKPVTDLFVPRPMSRPTMLQHARVLEACGLIRSEKVGRQRICHINRPALRVVSDWLDAQRAAWDARLDRFDAYVIDLHGKEQQS